MKKDKPFRELSYCSLKKMFWTACLAVILMNFGMLQAIANETYLLRTTAEMSEPQQARISGTITDAATGEALVGVNISVEGTSVGTISDAKGSFSLAAPALNAVLILSRKLTDFITSSRYTIPSTCLQPIFSHRVLEVMIVLKAHFF